MTSKTPALLRRPSNANDIRPFDAETAHVVMQDGGTVLVDRQSLDDLERRGITGRWYEYANGSGRSYVAVHLPSHIGGTTTVAGLIVQRQRGEGVTYANGNRRDLRLKNLVVSPRGAGRRKAWQDHAAMLFPQNRDEQAAWLQQRDGRRTCAGAADLSGRHRRSAGTPQSWRDCFRAWASARITWCSPRRLSRAACAK